MRSILSKQAEGTSRLPALVLHNPFTFFDSRSSFYLTHWCGISCRNCGKIKEGAFAMKRLDDESSKCTTFWARLLVRLIDLLENRLTFKSAHLFRLKIKSGGFVSKHPQTSLSKPKNRACQNMNPRCLFPFRSFRKKTPRKLQTNESFCSSAKLSSVEICVSHRTWYRSQSACM